MAAAINNQPPSKPPGPSCKWASMAADLQLGERRESRARTYAAELGAASLPRSVRGALCRGSPGSQPLMNAFLAGLAQISLFRWMCPCARFAPTPLRARSASHAHGSALQHRELRACCRDVRRWGAGCGAGKASQGRKQGAASAGDPPKPQARWADEGKNNLPRGPGRTGCGRSAWHPPTRLCAPPAFSFFFLSSDPFLPGSSFPVNACGVAVLCAEIAASFLSSSAAASALPAALLLNNPNPPILGVGNPSFGAGLLGSSLSLLSSEDEAACWLCFTSPCPKSCCTTAVPAASFSTRHPSPRATHGTHPLESVKETLDFF